MNQDIVKNISIIYQLIEIGDEETLAPIVKRSKKADTTDQFKYLWNALDNQRYDDALILIKDIEAQSRQLAMYYDPIVSALKVELHFQDSHLTFMIADRDEIAQKIEQFQIRYNNRVRNALNELLYLRKEKLKIQASIDSRLQSVYEAAEKEYAEFYEAFTSSVKGLLFSLSEEEAKELKSLYRRASMICHPDRVADEYKERAEAMFAELNEAYISNDIKKVRLITELLLKTGQFEPMSNRLDTSEALRARINWVLLQTEQIENEIRELEASEAFSTIQFIGNNWSEYFSNIVNNFNNQIEDLKNWHLGHSRNN